MSDRSYQTLIEDTSSNENENDGDRCFCIIHLYMTKLVKGHKNVEGEYCLKHIMTILFMYVDSPCR